MVVLMLLLLILVILRGQHDGLRRHPARHAPGAYLLRLRRGHRRGGLLLLPGDNVLPHHAGTQPLPQSLTVFNSMPLSAVHEKKISSK